MDTGREPKGRSVSAPSPGVAGSGSSTARTIRTSTEAKRQPRADESQPPVFTHEDVEQFSLTITTYVKSYFLTARLAAGG
jgi:hypothetical protein